MNNKLDEIISWKRQEIERLAEYAVEMRKCGIKRNDFRLFRDALMMNESVSVIAEVKKASPSVGVIVEKFEPIQIARGYEFAGAHALSILTDEKYFHGHLLYLKEVREQVKLPILRKDFIIHRHQIYESLVGNADAILLIVAALKEQELYDLYHEARDLQLDVLVEVHDLFEMERALDLEADLIGINNRNLQTFEVSLHTTLELAEEAPDEVVLVSESGIRNRQDVQKVADAGVNAILVGETLMRSQNIKATMADLLNVA